MPDQPIFAPLAYSGNPTLAPLANLPPDTQQALQDHGNRLLATPPPGTSVGPSVEQPPATLRPLGAAPDSNVLQIKAMKPMAVAASQPPPLAPTPHQQELARLTAPAPADASLKHTKANTGAAGESQIHNPLLRGLATVGDIALSTFAPVASMLTPGTQFHHQMLVGNARGAVSEDEGELNAKSKRELEEAQAAHANAEAGATKDEQPHTLVTAQGIMQWNPATHRFDIPAGQPAPKEEQVGKTITTDQGIMQWDPATKTYSIKAGDAPEKESADKTLQDADGVWYHVGKNHQAVPITVNGEPFKGKPAGEKSANAEQQFVDEYLANPANAKNGQKPTVAQAQRAYKQNEQLPPQRDPDVALDRETTRFAKPHEKSVADATSQLEKIADARAMINGSAESQALGIPKVLTALVSGAGSGVRITQPELNAIGNARGIKGDVEGFVNSLSGKGKLTDTQKYQLSQLLDDVQARVRQKQQIANDALDKINGARTRQEIIEVDKQARKQLSDMEKAGGKNNSGNAEGGYQVGHKYGGLTYQGGPVNDRASWK